MNSEQFRLTLSADDPPKLTPFGLALWYDAKGHWDIAHELAQRDSSEDGSWIHAYLHRKEGDHGNAAYWYRRARKPVYAGSLQSEWDQLLEYFLSTPAAGDQPR